MTQREIILKIMEDEPDKWFYSYELVKVATRYGWLGTQADRRARELVEEGKLERQEQGQYTQFRLKLSNKLF